MKKLRFLLLAPALLLFCSKSYADQFIVTNLANDGVGSLRNALEGASMLGGADTVIINIAGDLELEESITLDDASGGLVVIGPYAKHFNIIAKDGYADPAQALIHFNGASDVSFENVGFLNNATVNCRAMEFTDTDNTVRVVNCVFNGITHAGDGGAMRWNAINAGAMIEVINCSFVGCDAERGGAVAIDGGAGRFDNCTFSGNHCVGESGLPSGGGAMLLLSSAGSISYIHCTFRGNTCDEPGGGEAMHVGNSGAAWFANCASLFNGVNEQYTTSGSGFWGSGGGNVMIQNPLGDFIPPAIHPEDHVYPNFAAIPGMEPSIHTDGYGLMYWRIESPSSQFVDEGFTTFGNPNDCRRAPRTINGNGIGTWEPDAGAVEFTPLIVKTGAPGAGTANSIQWCVANPTDSPIDYIEFDVGAEALLLVDAQMDVTKDMIIDGYSNRLSAIPGPGSNPSIINDADSLVILRPTGGAVLCFNLSFPATFHSLSGVRINDFPEFGVVVSTAGQAEIFGNEIGLTSNDMVAANGFAGLQLKSPGHKIGGKLHFKRNVISGNGGSGAPNANIHTDIPGTDNYIYGNIIGLGGSGNAAVTGASTEFGIYNEGANNFIGAAERGARNIISLNGKGISNRASNTEIVGNYIGVSYDGLNSFGNIDGIELTAGGGSILVGKSGQFGRNVIAGNNGYQIDVKNSSGILFNNNFLGIDASGTTAIGGAAAGIYINHPTANSLSIGTNGGPNMNFIGGNGYGILIDDIGGDCIIAGNTIGLGNDGTTILPNVNDGITINSGVSNSIVIGTSATGNTISGHTGATSAGIRIDGANSQQIYNNIIGLNALGGDAGNTNGIIVTGADFTNIGGSVSGGQGNLVSGNNNVGIELSLACDQTTIRGNLIGTNAGGGPGFGNTNFGISINDVTNTTVGGSTDQRNVIGGSDAPGGAGILCTSTGSGTFIRGNYIGINEAATAEIANYNGITVTGSHYPQIGGVSPEENYIAGNDQAGVYCNSTTGALIDGNFIGIGPSSSIGFPNTTGIVIENQFVQVGGSNQNIIANNSAHGILINGSAASFNTINGCFIGTNSASSAVMGNGADGIRIDGGDQNDIGMTLGNFIANNGVHGITLTNGANYNDIDNNSIGFVGATDLGNANDGIHISAGSRDNLIGGSSAATYNTIMGNDGNGIHVNGSNHNFIHKNYIGNDGFSTTIPNLLAGIRIEGSDSTEVGFENPVLGDGRHNVISGNSGNGIDLIGSDINFIYGNYIGLDALGTSQMPNNTGINMDGSSDNNLVGESGSAEKKNYIAGNDLYGVNISGGNNKVRFNVIGLASDGVTEFAIPNQNIGIGITAAGNNNAIGGAEPTEGNYIAGNQDYGIQVQGNTNFIYGNNIGFATDGTAMVNQQTGIVLEQATCFDNEIGAPGGSNGNTIVSHVTSGIAIQSLATTNTIASNFIGTDITDAVGYGQPIGVEILSTAGVDNVIGDDVPGGGNIIGDNNVGIRFTGGNNQFVYNNRIGTTAASDGFLGNSIGIELTSGAQDNIIGAAGLGQNIISGNGLYGVLISGVSTSGNEVLNNIIGLNSVMTLSISNPTGVRIEAGAAGNKIGDSALGNVICANTDAGIDIDGAHNNEVYFNKIGPVFGNHHGVIVRGGATGNNIGGDGLGNIISGNDSLGVGLNNADATDIMNNWIGLDESADPLPNDIGVLVELSTNTQIGTSTLGDRNVISANSEEGIQIVNSTTTVVENNFIGTDTSGNASCAGCANNGGVLIQFGLLNVIGGNSGSDQGNVISGNANAGITVEASSSNDIFGNNIGITHDGTALLANGTDGIHLWLNADNNQIGGTSPGLGNAISGHPNSNVHIDGSDGNILEGNFIGTNTDGTDTLDGAYFQGEGISIRNASQLNQVRFGNVISGHGDDDGVEIEGSGSTDNKILGNIIGLDVNQSIRLPNNGGIAIKDSATANTIGSPAVGEQNTIAGNDLVNVFCEGYGTSNNVFHANFIGCTSTGSVFTTTYNSGFIQGASYNEIGGIGAGEGNYICGADSVGVYVWNDANNNIIVGNQIGVTPTGTNGGNVHGGVIVDASYSTEIGGLMDGSKNTIKFNGAGVKIINSSDSTTILGNDIYESDFLGIDFGGDDIAEVPDGAITPGGDNGLIDQPNVLSAFACDGGDGSLSVGFETTLPPGTYIFEVFKDTILSDLGEGPSFIYRETMTVTDNPDSLFLNTGTVVAVGHYITMTATEYNLGSSQPVRTSEFSNAVEVVNHPDFPTAVVTEETCYGLGNGSLEITADSAYHFTLAGNPTDTANQYILYDSLAVGTYTVVVEYRNGCTYNVTETIDPGPFMTFDTTVVGDTCNQSTGAILVHDILPTPTGTVWYSFNPSYVFATASDTTGLASGLYEVAVYDDGTGCYSDTLPITVPFVIDNFAAPEIVTTDSIYCEGDSIADLEIIGVGIYDWFIGAVGTTPDGDGNTFNPGILSPGDNYIYAIENDIWGCESFPDSINIFISDLSSMTAGPDVEICLGSSVQLGASGGSTYVWDYSMDLSELDIADPFLKASNEGYYYVTITNNEGCVKYDSLYLSLIPIGDCNLEVTNAFSPNGDGKNETLYIEGIEGYPENTVRIFNRWGDQIKRIDNYENETNAWGGESAFGDAKPGTYFFIVDVEDKSRMLSGWIQLLR